MAGRPARRPRREGRAPDDGPGRRARPARNDLRPDRDGRAGDHRRALPRGGLPRPADAVPAPGGRGGARGHPRARRRRGHRAHRQGHHDATVRRPRPRHRGHDRRADPSGGRRRDAPGGLARAGAGPGLSPGRRGRGHDPGGAPARLREPGRGRAVRGRGALPDRARGHAPDAPRRPRRRRSSGHRHRPGPEPGRPRDGPPPDDRHRPPAGRRAGGPCRLHRRQGGRSDGRRPGPLQRGDPGRGELPVVRRERLPDGRPGGPQGVHRPDRVVRLRAGVGVQDVHGPGRPREGHDQPVDPDPRLGLALARPRAGPDLRCRPARDGVHGSPRHRGLLAERRGGPDRARAGEYDRQGLQGPGRDLDPPRVRAEDRCRPGRRGPRPGPRPGAQALEPGRPRQRVVRPGRRRHPAPARHGLRGDGQRRDARHPARRARDRRPRRRAG